MATQVVIPRKTRRSSRRTGPQATAVLENVARYGTVTTKQLISFIHGTPNNPRTRKNSIQRTLRLLEQRGNIHSRPFIPDDYELGRLPFAYWLSKDGQDVATKLFPATDPMYHVKDRSDHNIPHDLATSETHHAIFSMALARGWEFGAKKTDISRVIKPDRLYEITARKTFHFFHEEERRKKSFEEMYAKLEPYVRLEGSSKFKELWGFRNFHVLVPMRDENSMTNLLMHLAGQCNCLDPTNKRAHENVPFRLSSKVLLFTTHDAIVKKTAGEILFTPGLSQPTSFLDIISE